MRRGNLTLLCIITRRSATLVTSLIKGEAVSWLHVAVSAGATGLLAALVAWVAIALYRRERILI